MGGEREGPPARLKGDPRPRLPHRTESRSVPNEETYRLRGVHPSYICRHLSTLCGNCGRGGGSEGLGGPVPLRRGPHPRVLVRDAGSLLEVALGGGKTWGCFAPAFPRRVFVVFELVRGTPAMGSGWFRKTGHHCFVPGFDLARCNRRDQKQSKHQPAYPEKLSVKNKNGSRSGGTSELCSAAVPAARWCKFLCQREGVGVGQNWTVPVRGGKRKGRTMGGVRGRMRCGKGGDDTSQARGFLAIKGSSRGKDVTG